MNYARFLTFTLICKCLATEVDYESEKNNFCANFKDCKGGGNEPVCGVRSEQGNMHRLKMFPNECELIRFGCQVRNKSDAYGIINMESCKHSFLKAKLKRMKSNIAMEACAKYNCTNDGNATCGIRQQGNGFKLRLFFNECGLNKYNCENNVTFYSTEMDYCDGLYVTETARNEDVDIDDRSYEVSEILVAKDEIRAPSEGLKTKRRVRKLKSVIISDGSFFNFNGNVNETFANFAAASHVFNIPLTDIGPLLNVSTRRRLVKIFGPAVFFRPAVEKPAVVLEDVWHKPTLDGCFHKCPTKCPHIYAPVCGVGGVSTREQSMVFQNHCYMDAMQCKMRWDSASRYAPGTTYTEASFITCVSEAIYGAYRFGPFIRTLQRMGRLKKRASFHYKVKNLRHYNELVSIHPNIRG